jgi:transcriptional regulator with PAS, ATPase and Fis domain
MDSSFKLNHLFDLLDEGILLINQDYRFEFINQKAKDILGLSYKGGHRFHESGKIVRGDIVILADNILGCDDGNLSPEALERHLSIENDEIEIGDVIAAIGVYGNRSVQPKYRFWRSSESALTYRMKEQFLDYDVEICIDEVHKMMSVIVDDKVYDMPYIYSIGFMVVIDGKTGQVKFFQDTGYSYRNESIRELLEGLPFREKKENGPSVDLIGESVEHIEGLEDLHQRIDTAIRNGESIKGDIVEINHRPVICSILPAGDAPINGVIVKIDSVAELQDFLKLRNDIVKNIIRSEDHIRDKIRQDNAKLLTGITGSSAYINNVKSLAYKAAMTHTTVLITGESGTGKSLLAKEIHRVSGRTGEFIHVNCGAIPENLFESELFGYVKGSFSGASNSGKVGYFEAAAGGTIFLDEIGEVPVHIQAKLLHVLQEKQFYKIGDTKPTTTDARIIAATNIDLEEAVSKGTFRNDLYYRVNVFPINIPPLRKRKRDLYVLINNILDDASKEMGIREKQLSGEAFEKIMNYDWPGNVRELENVLVRAVLISETNIVYPEHINISVENINMILKDILEATEKKTILETLDACNYSNKITMRKLGISKSAYYEKLKKYNIVTDSK